MAKARFTKADLMAANARLKMLAFYPQDGQAQGAIMALLARMCPDTEALNWLVDAMVNRVGTWRGPAEMRGVGGTGRQTASKGIPLLRDSRRQTASVSRSSGTARSGKSRVGPFPRWRDCSRRRNDCLRRRRP